MRVLLIEDDSATAQSIELMLKSEIFNGYTTDSGEEALSIPSAKLLDYDIILLDLNLPVHFGLRWFLRTTACLPRSRRPILILSRSPRIEYKVRGLGFGATTT